MCNLDRTDSRGQTVTFPYDGLNRITEKLYPDGGKVMYDYDDDAVANSEGKLTRARVVDSAGVDQSRVEFAYDKIGRATTTKYTVLDSSTEVSRSFVNTYDSMSRIKSIKYPDNETVNYSYDSGGNISQISGYATFPSYTALGQMKTITYSNGVTTGLTYRDPHQRLETLQTTGPGGSLQSLYYDIYDKAGNIRSIQDNQATGRTQAFTYKLIPSSPLSTARSTAYGNLGLTYDVSDNITNYTPVGPYTPKAGYSGLIAGAGPYLFSHDSNGNTRLIVENDALGVEIGRRIIGYNYDHRVSGVNKDGVVTSFAYDFSGMRVKKQTGSSRTLYFGELYESTGGSNMKHIFAGGRRIASRKSANEIYYYHTDHLGSTRVLTDKDGEEVQTFFYDPFGKTRPENVTGSSPINYKYTGQEEDPETGLYYYKARYYDPVIGRFLSHDPLFQAYFDPPTFPRLLRFGYLPKVPPIYSKAGTLGMATVLGKILNPYAYVNNNPLNWTDPYGLEKACYGWILYSAVGPNQAQGNGALGFPPPNDSVAISPAAFGLKYGEGLTGQAQLSERAATQQEIGNHVSEIRISAPGLSEYLTGDTTFTIGDVGDQNIRNSPVTRFDIYRFDTNEDANTFGKEAAETTISGLPDSWSCPPGTQEIPVPFSSSQAVDSNTASPETQVSVSNSNFEINFSIPF
ncbi:MAG: RHS repeat-associated core domain-containing protein [Syntrophobacteraceae bacterium]